MRLIKLVSPDGKANIMCHPASYENMINAGWKHPKEVKSTKATKSKHEGNK